ncbi:MAG: 1-deoxy-D-xylulose-5-phosphate synthase [Ruminococcaceae bacterium]|nr:1-deoxy-D-xylulose-5-phosphate synthase [Oscillospiraceae bacterium]
MILEQIQDPSDVKKLNDEQVRQLCAELRDFLVEKVSHTGGHLASNLGVVELTVAIHRVFDTSRDRLVFDVGHQCYAHKALTGRRDRFDTLRQLDGLSGFPKPRESIHDAFIAGHASNSVSVALGMARARTLQKEDYQVLALIGDGALNGGMSFEGLNDAGASGEQMIVILNDNGMSISRNVGGLSRHLARLRTRPEYIAFKQIYRQKLSGSAVGKKLYHLSHQVKTALKKTLLPDITVFENMGFTYLGPVDGHNVEQLTQVLTLARNIRGPVLLHVDTVKGKGYPPAEREPDRFHGTGPFDTRTGAALGEKTESFSAVFGATLTELAHQDGRVCAVTAGMRDGTGLSGFAKEFPERFFDVGIAEAHAVGMAAGMARQGLIPVCAVYSSFLQRGFDQLIHDVALQGLHVVFGVDRTGLVGADGETHHGCFDPVYLAQVPGMTVLCPASFAELREMLQYAIRDCGGPVAIRYPRGEEESYRDCADTGPAGVILQRGEDCTITTYGVLVNQALEAAELLRRRGIDARVVKWNRISRFETDEVITLLGGSPCLLVLEDCMATGCVGQRLAAILAQNGAVPERVILKNCGTTVPDHGTVAQLLHRCALDAEAIAAAVEEALA